MKKLIVAIILFYGMTAMAQQPKDLRVNLMLEADMQVVNGYRVPAVHTKEAFLQSTSVKIGSKNAQFYWQAPEWKPGDRSFVYLSGYPDTSDVFLRPGLERPLEPNKLYRWRVKLVRDKKEYLSDHAYFFTDSVLTDDVSGKYPLLKTDESAGRLSNEQGIFRADFGKAVFGQLKLKLTGEKGDSILVRLGEAILPDGSINRKPGGSIRFQQYAIHLQPGTHVYEVKIRKDARNTGPQAIKMPDYIGEVLPFRYVEVEGYKGNLLQEDVIRVAVNYPFNDSAAYFESSDTILNAVWEMSKHTMKATSFAGIYVDGDRERIPYEADAYINQLGHYATDHEYTLARQSLRHLMFNATWPTEWILQMPIMAWHDRLYTDDITFAKRYYNELKAKLLMPLAGDSNLISTRNGKQTPELLRSIHYNGKELRDIVDWPHTGILGLKASEGGETDGFVFTEYNAVVNAYYYRALWSMYQLATAMADIEERDMMLERMNHVKASYQELLWDRERKVYRDGVGTDHASLHTNMFALAFGLVKEEDKAAVMAFIRSRGMACSVYGSQFLMDAIYEAGDGEYGLSLLRSQDERSWYNMIRAGSTMAMEAWDNKFKPNQDWNHAWGAVPANIIPRKLMGIEPDAPGWYVFKVQPQPGSLAYAKIRVPTIKGPVDMEFRQNEQEFVMELSVPVNATANCKLPCEGLIFLNEKKVKKLPPLKTGHYKIRVRKK